MGSGNPANYGNESNARGSAMFHGVPIYQMVSDPTEGIYQYENFGGMPTIPAAEVAAPFRVLFDTGCTILRASRRGGGATITHDGTDNDAVHYQAGPANAGGEIFIDRSSNLAVVCFETLFQQSSVADNVIAWASGLASPIALATGNLVADTGILVSASMDFIGFQVVHANGGTAGTNALVRFVYKVAGNPETVVIANMGTLAAATDVKFGFRYDPARPPGQRIAAYRNDVENTSAYVSDTAIAASTFPKAIPLVRSHFTKLGSATACTQTIAYQRACWKPV